jgi:hypothetical protein
MNKRAQQTMVKWLVALPRLRTLVIDTPAAVDVVNLFQSTDNLISKDVVRGRVAVGRDQRPAGRSIL